MALQARRLSRAVVPIYHAWTKRLELTTKLLSINACSIRNASFAQDLSLGKLNLDWLFPYPTLESREDLDEINILSQSVGKFFDERVDSKKFDLEAKIDDDVMKEIKEMGLCGLQVPVEYGGLGLNNLQYAHIVQELAKDGSIYMILAHHLMAVKSILFGGNEEQKERLLSELASGDSIGGFCFSESPDGLDAQQIETFAHLNEGGTEWILNGEKTLVTNGNSGGVFIVFAKTRLYDVKDKQVDKITAFVVERNFDGVSAGEMNDQIGVRASETCSLFFDNTPVPVANILGEVGKGYKIAMDVMNSTRFASGCYASGLLRNLIRPACEHAHERQQFGTELAEFGLIQKKITEITCEAYAMESVAFIVAHQTDLHPHDCYIEAAMVKIYSSETAWKYTSECLQVFGGLGYMKDYPYERMLRDSSYGLVFQGPNHLLKLYVALSSLKFASKELEVLAANMFNFSSPERKLRVKYHDADGSHLERLPWIRDGLHHTPATQRTADDLSLNFLHPQLHGCGKIVEHCVDVFFTRLLVLMKLHGKTLPTDELMLETLADVSTQIFVMAAVLTRCNKSLLFRLPNCENELNIASLFINKTFRDVEHRLQEIHVDFAEGFIPEQREVSRKTMKDQEYLFTHPLEVLHRYFDHPKYLESMDKIKALP